MEVLRKYNQATTIRFPLIDAGTQDFAGSGDYTAAAGDLQISKDEGTFTNTNTTTPTFEGNGMWSIALTATEMSAARIMLTVIDSATKAVEDQAVLIATYGNASAEHEFDLDSDTVEVGTKTGFSLSAAGVDAILDEAITEPSGRPTWAGATLRNLMGWIGALSLNKGIVTKSTGNTQLRNDADSGDIATHTATDTGAVYTRGEWA